MRLLPVALALLGLPLPAAAQDMCAGLNRIAAAARESVPFASLADETQRLLPGLEGSCRYRPADGDRRGTIVCRRNFAPEGLAPAPLARALRDCVGATYVPGPTARAVGEFRAGDLRIRVYSHCSEACQLGRIVTLIFTRRRETDAPRPARRRRPASN